MLQGISTQARVSGNGYEMWCLRGAVVERRRLRIGLHLEEIKTYVQASHPTGSSVTKGAISAALRGLVRMQITLNVRPTVLDFDSSANILRVVDRGLLLWLDYQPEADVLDLIDTSP